MKALEKKTVEATRFDYEMVMKSIEMLKKAKVDLEATLAEFENQLDNDGGEAVALSSDLVDISDTIKEYANVLYHCTDDYYFDDDEY